MSHHTHAHTHVWTFNYQSVIYTVRGGIFLSSEIFPRDMFTFEAHYKVF